MCVCGPTEKLERQRCEGHVGVAELSQRLGKHGGVGRAGLSPQLHLLQGSAHDVWRGGHLVREKERVCERVCVSELNGQGWQA